MDMGLSRDDKSLSVKKFLCATINLVQDILLTGNISYLIMNAVQFTYLLPWTSRHHNLKVAIINLYSQIN